MTEIKDTIIEKIKAGQIAMKPRWHFVLETLLTIITVGIVATLAVYLLSFAVFVLEKTGILFAPSFGLQGIGFFLFSSPWFILSLTGFFLLLLYILITHFSFSYKRPFVYSLLGVVLSVVLLSSILHHLAFHERVQNFAERKNLPGMAPFYKKMGERPEGMWVGMLVEKEVERFSMRTEQGGMLNVLLTSQTKGRDIESLQKGDVLMVFGQEREFGVEAFGIKPIDTNLDQRKGGMRKR